MSTGERDYARYLLTRACESLEDAALLLKNDRLHSAVNRLYYACFYAVSALLQTKGMSSAKHAGVLSLLDRHWVKTGAVPVAMSRFYRDLFSQRLDSDYGDKVTFERHDVQAWCGQAQQFVSTTSALAQEQLQHDEKVE